MDWLATHRANIDCKNLKITLKDQKGLEACLYGEREGQEYPIILVMKAGKLLSQGYIG